MLISYNSDQLVKDRFKDWNCAEFDLTYTCLLYTSDAADDQ